MAELSKASVAQLEREIGKRKKRIAQLEEKRAGLAAQLEAVDGELESLRGGGGAVATEAPAKAEPKPKQKQKRVAAKTTGARPGRRPMLTEAIRSILSDAGEPLNAGAIAAQLKARRFKTKSKNLQNLVREALSRIPDVNRVSRGLYSLG